MPRLDGVRVDGAVLLFVSAVGVAAVHVAVVGVGRRVGRRRRADARASRVRTTSRLGGARIVTAEIAIGLVLSVLAALMVRSLANLRSVDLGFQTGSVVDGARVASGRSVSERGPRSARSSMS